jgi:hypothetical protein
MTVAVAAAGKNNTQPLSCYWYHYQKQSLHCEPRALPRAKAPALGEASLRREHLVWLSAKDWPTVQSPFTESILLSTLSEGLS